MKITIEGKSDEIRNLLKNLSATDDSQEITDFISTSFEKSSKLL